MQQLLGHFDGTDPTYTTEDSLNDVIANMGQQDQKKFIHLFLKAWIL